MRKRKTLLLRPTGRPTPGPMRLPVSSFPLYPRRKVKLQLSFPSLYQDSDEVVRGGDREPLLRGILSVIHNSWESNRTEPPPDVRHDAPRWPDGLPLNVGGWTDGREEGDDKSMGVIKGLLSLLTVPR